MSQHDLSAELTLSSMPREARLTQLGLGGTIDRGSVEDDPAELVCAEKMRGEEVQRLLHMCFDSGSEYAAYLSTP